jgi:hypothetical protein
LRAVARIDVAVSDHDGPHLVIAGGEPPCNPLAKTRTQKSGASERRSEVSRVPTPYADITQIRFWGLRLTALSAPPGAPPSYSVVRRVYVVPLRRLQGFSPPR